LPRSHIPDPMIIFLSSFYLTWQYLSSDTALASMMLHIHIYYSFLAFLTDFCSVDFYMLVWKTTYIFSQMILCCGFQDSLHADKFQLCICNPGPYNELWICITNHLLYVSTNMNTKYLRHLKTKTELSIFPFSAHNCWDPTTTNMVSTYFSAWIRYLRVVLDSFLTPTLTFTHTCILQ
jgi:hypothetical protein